MNRAHRSPVCVVVLETVFWISITIIRTCWILFVVVWLIAATLTKRSVYHENRLARLRYTIFLALGVWLLFRGARLRFPFNVSIIPRNDLIAAIGAIACVVGLVFCIWARLVLGRNWSGTITLKEDHELITRGPYRWVRHPIYTGLLAMCVGTMLVTDHVAGFLGLALIFVSIWIKLRYEEALMLRQFPTEYPQYRKRVKTIIPFIL